MVNLPFQLPTQIGQDDAFDRVMQAPPIIRYTTMISGNFDASKVSDATNLLLASSAGTIFQFWNAQQQLANLSGLPQVGGAAKLPAMDLRYTRNQNTSQLDVTLYPEAVANLEEALEYEEQKHEKGDLPLQIMWGRMIKINVPFTDWGLYYAFPGGHKTWPSIGWATGAGVGPLLAYAGNEALQRKQYFEVKLIKLPRGKTPPDDIHTLGGAASNDYTDSPIKHHTAAEDRWKWPSQLDTFYTPTIGIARKDALESINPELKNPYQYLAPGILPNTVGGVALSMMYGKVHTHTEVSTTTGGYLLHNDDPTFKWADYYIAGPDVTDTTPRYWNENEIIGRDGYLYQVAFGSSGFAPATGPDSSNATPGFTSQFTWEGLTWFYIGGVADGLLNLTTIGFIQTDRPIATSDLTLYNPPDPLVLGTNYVYAAGDIPSDGFLWVPAPAIAPDGYAMNYADPTATYVGGFHQSNTGICSNHVEYVSPTTVVTPTDTYSPRHKYGDIFTGVPGAVAFDDGSTESEIPPNHGEGRTFPILKDFQWPGSEGVNLGDLKDGDVVRVAVDMKEGKIWFGLNEEWKGEPGKYGHAQTFDVSDKDLPWYPVAGGFGEFKGRLCLGAGLAYDPPGGFERAGGDTISFDIPYDIS